MKFYATILLFCLALSAPVYAENLTTTVYLSPRVYQLHGHLTSPYREYWFNQAVLFEPIVLKTLQEKYADLTLCKTGRVADRVIKLTPDIFYNPQMRVLHGQVIANVYSGGGTLLGAYVGEAQQVGSIDVTVDDHIKKAYLAAMQNLVEKLSLSEQAYTVNSEIKLPCSVVGAQAEPQNGFY